MLYNLFKVTILRLNCCNISQIWNAGVIDFGNFYPQSEVLSALSVSGWVLIQWSNWNLKIWFRIFWHKLIDGRCNLFKMRNPPEQSVWSCFLVGGNAF